MLMLLSTRASLGSFLKNIGKESNLHSFSKLQSTHNGQYTALSVPCPHPLPKRRLVMDWETDLGFRLTFLALDESVLSRGLSAPIFTIRVELDLHHQTPMFL
jgi:hypothetical protein